MSTALIVYGSTFVTVFALGIQSLNVNQRMYLAAGLTSIAISSGHLWLYKVMPNPGWADLAGFYAGGVTGITTSIWAHPHIKAWIERIKRRGERPVDEHIAQHYPACRECGVAAGAQCQRLVCDRFQPDKP